MQKLVLFGILIALVALVQSKPQQAEKKVVNLEVGGYCAPAAAPTGPNGSWQVIQTNEQKVCPAGTTCRKGACNCDNLPDGTVISHTWDPVKEQRTCKRIGGQTCTETSQCVNDAACLKGVCTCDKTIKDSFCSDEKVDIIILN